MGFPDRLNVVENASELAHRPQGGLGGLSRRVLSEPVVDADELAVHDIKGIRVRHSRGLLL